MGVHMATLWDADPGSPKQGRSRPRPACPLRHCRLGAGGANRKGTSGMERSRRTHQQPDFLHLHPTV